MSAPKRKENIDMARKKHSSDFKKKVAIEALREQKTISQIAKDCNGQPCCINAFTSFLGFFIGPFDGSKRYFGRHAFDLCNNTVRRSEVLAKRGETVYHVCKLPFT